MPAKAGIQNYLKTLDSRLRGNDANGRFKTFYETINIDDATLYLILRQANRKISKGSFASPNPFYKIKVGYINFSSFLSAVILED